MQIYTSYYIIDSIKKKNSMTKSEGNRRRHEVTSMAVSGFCGRNHFYSGSWCCCVTMFLWLFPHPCARWRHKLNSVGYKTRRGYECRRWILWLVVQDKRREAESRSMVDVLEKHCLHE